MTKKHFIALAEALRDIQPSNLVPAQAQSSATAQWQLTLLRLADFCASQNPNFNRERWLGYIAGTNGKNGGKL